MTGLDMVKDILIDSVLWRSESVATDTKLINFDKVTAKELADLTDSLDETLRKIHSLFGRWEQNNGIKEAGVETSALAFFSLFTIPLMKTIKTIFTKGGKICLKSLKFMD